MRIECKDCSMHETEHCDDCLVTALLRPQDGVVDIDEALQPSLRAASDAGLIPVLRFRPRDPSPPGEGEAQASSA